MPISLDAFDVGLVTFDGLKKLDNGAVVGIKYGAGDLEIKLPRARVPFDVARGYENKGDKLEVKLELPADQADFQQARRVLSSIDGAVSEHLRTGADTIPGLMKLAGRAATEKRADLASGNKLYPILRPSNNEKYPDTVTLKWAESKAPKIVDTSNRKLPWSAIKHNSTVTAVVRVKGIFLNTSLSSVQLEPIALLIGRQTEVSTTALFSDELEADAVGDEEEDAEDGEPGSKRRRGEGDGAESA